MCASEIKNLLSKSWKCIYHRSEHLSIFYVQLAWNETLLYSNKKEKKRIKKKMRRAIANVKNRNSLPR